jgi:hypothetical protein
MRHVPWVLCTACAFAAFPAVGLGGTTYLSQERYVQALDLRVDALNFDPFVEHVHDEEIFGDPPGGDEGRIGDATQDSTLSDSGIFYAATVVAGPILSTNLQGTGASGFAESFLSVRFSIDTPTRFHLTFFDDVAFGNFFDDANIRRAELRDGDSGDVLAFADPNFPPPGIDGELLPGEYEFLAVTRVSDHDLLFSQPWSAEWKVELRLEPIPIPLPPALLSIAAGVPVVGAFVLRKRL